MRTRAAMVRSMLVAVGWIAGCGEDEPEPPELERDAGSDASSCENPSLDQLRQSRARWSELAAKSGKTYWYEEENCRVNSVSGDISRVQVEGGQIESTSVQQIERSACESQINRYSDFRALTFEGLYDLCETLLEQVCVARLFTDERGVLERCSFHVDPPECLDNCGDGVHIRRWAFGRAPAT